MNPAEARRIFRVKIAQAMVPFRLYGLDVYEPGALHEITAAAEELVRNLRGNDKPAGASNA